LPDFFDDSALELLEVGLDGLVGQQVHVETAPLDLSLAAKAG
jgi:hypothetical protein